jgi:hypothetical protein
MIEAIKTLKSESDVIALTRKCVESLSAQHFVYTSFLSDHAKPMQESRRFFIGCSPAWCQLYNARKWFETDPFVLYAKNYNTAPVLGSEIALQSAGQSEMLKTAGEYGFKSCMVIPVHTGNVCHMGILYVGSPEAPCAGEPKLMRNRGYYRLLAAELLDWWVRRIREEALGAYKLDPLEVVVLQLELEGFAAKEKARELGIPIHSVYAMYRKIKARFEVDNVRDAARIAQSRGILNYTGME